jgi:hypothetical protein
MPSAFAQANTVTTPAELTRKSKAGLPEGEVQVRGILVNKGSNYFTDQQFVLRDPDTGAEIYVQPWLPLQVLRVPGRDYSGSGSPAVQSDFLNKEVILKGHFSKAQLRNLGTVTALSVEEARIVSD